MKKQILTTFIMSVLLLFSGCADKEEPAQITISESSIEYFQDRMDFSSEGGSQVIKFSTNKNWEISVSESGMGVDWCTVSPKSGVTGDVMLTISVPENTTYDERSVILKITAGDSSEKLRVSQKQNDAILLSSTLYEVPMEGGEIQLQVRSNVNYQVEIPEQYRGWIHQGNSTRSLESKDLIFTIDNNLDYDKRQGEIIISDGNITEVVKVYQAGGGILVLSENQHNVPSNGGTVTIDLSSNFEYEFELPNVDWLKPANGTRGMSSHTLYFEVSPNEGYDDRSANIRFYDPSGTVSETVTVNQAQKDALIISTKEFSVDAGLNYLSVDINTNIEYEVEIPQEYASWIRQAENPLTRTLNPYKLDFVISENDTFDDREGKIIIKGKDKDISDIVTVDQAQNDAIFIESTKDVNVSYEGGIVNVDVNSNVDIELEFLQDWTHFVDNQTRGLVKSSHSFVVDENDTPYNRMGTVVVRKVNANLPADTMYVHQEKGFLILDVTPGNLSKLLSEHNDVTVEMLKLSGSLNVQDYLTLRDIKTLWNLDLFNLTDITMPKQAFMGIDNIKTINLPNNLVEIPDQLFDMTGFGEVGHGLSCELTIPTSVKLIGKNAFGNCSQIVGNLIIPDNVEEIKEYAFQNLWSISSLTIGNGVKTLGNGCFAGLSNLKHLNIGENVEVMENDVFNSCGYVGTIIIPDKVISIGNTFFNASKFTCIVFGESLSSIGWFSLNGISDLKSIYCKSKTPPSYYFPIEGTPMLYLGVPLGTKDIYEQVAPWKDFMVIEEIDYDNFVIPGAN